MKVREAKYWSSVCIAFSQVFLGVIAGLIFTGDLDPHELRVVELNLILVGMLISFGRRQLK